MDASFFFVFFFVFVFGGIALTIWALVDAVRMPDDRSFKTGTQLVWILVDPARARGRRDRLSDRRSAAGRRERGASARDARTLDAAASSSERRAVALLR